MREIYILRGAQGSGKSTLIESMNMRDHTLSFDAMRQMFYGMRTTFDGNLSSTGDTDQYEREVVKATFRAAESRMNIGDTLFIDNMNLGARDIRRWAELAHKYFYTLYVVDVQSDLTDDQLLARNARRGYKRVADEVVLKCAQRGRNWDGFEDYTVISIDQMRDQIENPKLNVDASTYESVVIIGDVHGHTTELDELTDQFGGLDNENILFVFVGDIIDRGYDNVGAVERITRAGSNVIVVEGNHEMNMRHILSHTSNRKFGHTRQTRDQLISAGWKAKDIRQKFLNKLVPVVRLVNLPNLDQDVIVTHAGTILDVTAQNVHAFPVTEFVYGTSHRDKVYHGHSSYSMDVNDLLVSNMGTLSVHGHRNDPNASGIYRFDTGSAYNLEAGVTQGGSLRAMVITKGTVRKIDIPVVESKTPAQNAPEITVSDLKQHSFVRTRDAGDGIVSYNFTRDAFYNQEWDVVTTKARGLFIRGNKVVGRGYDKFFNMGERHGYTRDEIMANFVYPVDISRKVNGFLGIMFADQGKLKLFSKSGPTDYSRAAEDLIQLKGSERDLLVKILEENDASLTVEVVHPDDPHIVSESAGVYILDVVANEFSFRTLDDVRETIEREVPSLRSKEHHTVSTPAQLEATLDKAITAEDEGIVMRDAQGRMSKIKSDHYVHIKSLRTMLNQALRGKTEKLEKSQDPLAVAIREDIGVERLDEFSVKTLGRGVEINIPELVSYMESKNN